ncbi:hypothetical protein [Calothrix sp. UHCC 0171]|uniref:hypothetical protein n=1 Tax=Calothrix sp. UHCC 0171 TaxID=3110245 RepID=UPI002B20B3EE|nr:hypothetical protein [Calothrix sp. UHCC 0171]MEA5571061.1 hypothetical protein [Calothrix sp. UHCC 0171]
MSIVQRSVREIADTTLFSAIFEEIKSPVNKTNAIIAYGKLKNVNIACVDNLIAIGILHFWDVKAFSR